MIIRKSTCGLCKPSKKFKKNKTRLKSHFYNILADGDLTSSLINSYRKLNKF